MMQASVTKATANKVADKAHGQNNIMHKMKHVGKPVIFITTY